MIQTTQKVLSLVRSRYGTAGLFIFSVLESTILPFTMELVLLPMMVSKRDRIFGYAMVALLGCIAGAVIGYGIGYSLFEGYGQQLLTSLGWTEQYETFKASFDEQGFWALVVIGVSPVPFQIGMLVAGASGYPILMFLLASALARGVRYFGLGVLVWIFGKSVRRWFGSNDSQPAAQQQTGGG